MNIKENIWLKNHVKSLSSLTPLTLILSTTACSFSDLVTSNDPKYSATRGAIGAILIGIEAFGTKPIKKALLETNRMDKAISLLVFTLAVPILGGVLGYYSNTASYISLAIPAAVFVCWLAGKTRNLPTKN